MVVRIPGTDEVLNDVSETWWRIQSGANLSLPAILGKQGGFGVASVRRQGVGELP